MNYLEAFRMAWSSLRTNKLRSALTLLGMVIGVFAIIASVTAVKVIDVYFEESLSLLGTSTFTVTRYPAIQIDDREYRNRPSITYDQVERLEESLDLPLIVSPLDDFSRVSVRYGEEETEPNVILFGTDEDFPVNYGYEVEEGRPLSASDVLYGRRVVMLGKTVAENLFSTVNPIGKDVRMDGRRYQVVGVLAEKGGFIGVDWDNRVLAPITTMFNDYGGLDRNIGSVSVRAPTMQAVPAAMEHVMGKMRVIRKVGPGEENNFELETNDSMQGVFDAFTGVLTAGGAGIGLIALLAAGIGIMNIMLVSVTERTREIGVRKSIGARRRDILRQFLLEAIFLCQIGGLLGILLGALFGNLVAVYFDISAAFPMGWAIGGVLAVTAIALVFGGYPAFKAARLDPIDALRYE